MTYVITDACIDVKDQKCMKECPVDCIYLADRSAYIQPEECIDCGACVSVCPVKAIVYENELRPEQRYLLQRQAEAFRAIGAPGGARAFGRLAADHPDIAAMPVKSPNP
jgi:NAD-dependent dihydropyrimidine dehydrogenase PreA subunit